MTSKILQDINIYINKDTSRTPQATATANLKPTLLQSSCLVSRQRGGKSSPHTAEGPRCLQWSQGAFNEEKASISVHCAADSTYLIFISAVLAYSCTTS